MALLALKDPGPFGGGALTFVNRCRARGLAVAETDSGFAVPAEAAPALRALGFGDAAGGAAAGEAPGGGLPRIAIYNGAAVGYPYWAYYAHALLSLGLPYVPVDAEAVAAGALDGVDLLVMPGGFATWGLDRAEGIAGIDAAIRAFITRGGALIGSCGGAFYASEGRPGWLGLVDAMPRFTQEYLLTGAAMLSIEIGDPVLGRGLPETIEVPYYHGPVYRDGPRKARACGMFAGYIAPARLFIDNPLDRDLFEAEMRGTPAILAAADPAVRAILFSPHPEMGEFVRKGMALADAGYARRYLPIRGHKVMDETLRFYMKDDCAGFRLIHNAVAALGLFALPQAVPASSAPARPLGAVLADLDAAMGPAFAGLRELAGREDAAMQRLAGAEIDRLEGEWTAVLASLRQEEAGADPLVSGALASVLEEAIPDLAAPRALAEKMVVSELPLRLCAAALRILVTDKALETC